MPCGVEVSANNLPDDPIQVYLLIENRFVRETLVRLFRKRLDICVVGESAASEMPASENLGDIVVLNDLSAAAVLGSRLLFEPAAGRPVRLVLIGMEADGEQFLTAVRSGVAGFLLNDASANEIVSAVRSVAREEAVWPPRALPHAHSQFGGCSAGSAGAAQGESRLRSYPPPATIGFPRGEGPNQ